VGIVLNVRVCNIFVAEHVAVVLCSFRSQDDPAS
jgi:hypothetical protein